MSNARKAAIPVKSFQVRLRNRRVNGGLLADGSTLWKFKSLTSEGTIYGDKIRLSREAVMAMFDIMAALDAPETEGRK